MTNLDGMDPDEALWQLRMMVKQMRLDESQAIRKAHADEIAERFEALDQYLAGGGFLPVRWSAR
jgi:hypothetical protein